MRIFFFPSVIEVNINELKLILYVATSFLPIAGSIVLDCNIKI